MTENTGLMEPPLPPEGTGRLDDLVVDLVSKASSFAGMLNPVVGRSVGNFVRSMNCYYSNLIEGHDRHPEKLIARLRKTIQMNRKSMRFKKRLLPILPFKK